MSPASAATLWLLNGERVSDARLASLAASLGHGERERHARFLRPQRAREFLLGRMLLRHAAHTMLGDAATGIAVTEREGHAPLLAFPAPHASSAFHFSLSHSRGWIACIASTVCHVGLDIEDTSRPRDIAATGAAAFDTEEMEWMMQQPEQQRLAAFYRLWGCKEALYKLAGNRGQDDTLSDTGNGWNCRAIPHERLAICLCSAASLDAVEIVELDGM
ncbi:4'-phosphopantetheinyl transferase family protein [Herbaspirillum rhizosphaerae]|uniref:4'-phosphopantetheinyl transferase family protein n=1 Tax=Herbaspirillum rhizosphaerae TaxID=346179 RepID=UPI00067D2130|nr:4'-phosphopantetheinyl transferase superfamily protein [Herbaspirillum rhizosphaerae]